LANKMKAKGLQKLRWYCQMCQKQCRDENGFKCHRMSEGHQRMMQTFIQSPGKFLDAFSREFEEGFMKLMRTKYSRQRVLANTVYCEFISDKNHIHMNSTIWVTLSGFCQYLGRTGKCKIDHTEKGWYVEYIDQEKIKREQELEAKRAYELTEEERQKAEIAERVEKAQAAGLYREAEYTELMREDPDEKIAFKMPEVRLKAEKTEEGEEGAPGPSKPRNLFAELAKQRRAEKAQNNGTVGASSNANGHGEGIVDVSGPDASASASASASFSGQLDRRADEKDKRKLSALERLRLENEERKLKKVKTETNSTPTPAPAPASAVKQEDVEEETWLSEGLVVKVVLKDLAGGKYYKKKGKVTNVPKPFTGDIRMLDSGDVLRLDETHLETVIPNVGGRVRIVKGVHRGEEGVLKAVHLEQFCATVETAAGVREGMQYEQVCKLMADE